MNTYIFGAKATAAGLYKAFLHQSPRKDIEGFLVSDMKGNCPEIWGKPVISVGQLSNGLTVDNKEEIEIYVAVPKTLHGEIKAFLEEEGFNNLVFIDSGKEAEIMEKYFESESLYKSIHKLSFDEKELPKVTVYAASFYKDKKLSDPPIMPPYVKSLYLGCEGAKKAGIDITGLADFYDNTGDNISDNNPNRCEMTAHYWVWKNRLDTDDEYVGIYHYRRILDLSSEDLQRIKSNDVDVVLPFPMIHYPSAGIQHTWYVKEKDWELMRKVIAELYPEYAEKFDVVFGSEYFYNYNMMLAKKEVFADYCAWLYPILDRIEALSEPKGCERHDRYTAYMSESLTTLYFMANLNNLKIYHTGRQLYI